MPDFPHFDVVKQTLNVGLQDSVTFEITLLQDQLAVTVNGEPIMWEDFYVTAAGSINHAASVTFHDKLVPGKNVFVITLVNHYHDNPGLNPAEVRGRLRIGVNEHTMDFRKDANPAGLQFPGAVHQRWVELVKG